MSDPDRPRRAQPLVKRIVGELDVHHVGLGFALLAATVCALTLGLGPTAIAIGLLALLVVD